VAGEQSATAEFEVRGKSTVTFEVPLEAERIEPHTVGSVGRLENEEDGDGVDRILEAPAEKSRQMRAGQDPPVAQAGIEDAGVTSSAANRVAASGPDLDFVAALLWTCLSETQG
jgi:hypothetical protein